MQPEEWENICRKCGKCCYEKVDLGAGIVRYLDEPCAHLDTATNMCKVYHNRHEVEPDCISLTPELVRELYWLPEDCAYVAHMRHLDTIEAVRNAERKAKGRGKSKRRKK